MWQGTDRLGQGVVHTPWGCEGLATGNASCNPQFVLDGDGPGFDSGGNRLDLYWHLELCHVVILSQRQRAGPQWPGPPHCLMCPR